MLRHSFGPLNGNKVIVEIYSARLELIGLDRKAESGRPNRKKTVRPNRKKTGRPNFTIRLNI